MSALAKRSWSPWVVGAALGVLSWFAFLTADRGLGITTAFESSAALTLRAIAPTTSADYFADIEQAPRIDWEWMLVVGVFIGAFASARRSGDRTREALPRAWLRAFGTSHRKRYVLAFAGGALLMFGARLAGGCTSGHGITGALQLAVSSWVFLIAFFAVAALVARALYGRALR